MSSVPATQALRDAGQFAVRAQRLLRRLEVELLDEFEDELEQLKDTIRDVDMILAQRRGRWRPPPPWGPGAPG